MNKEEKTIDQLRFGLTPRVALSVVGFLLVVSNLFTRHIIVIEQNEQNIIKNDEANRRRIKNAMLESELKQKIRTLNTQLKDCKDGFNTRRQ